MCYRRIAAKGIQLLSQGVQWPQGIVQLWDGNMSCIPGCGDRNVYVSCEVCCGQPLGYMKTMLRKRFRQFLAKAIIVLAGILVVAPQISYKFFLYANLPSYTAHHRAPHIGQPAGTGSSQLAHKSNSHLRIDKRYTAKHIFALPSIAFVFPLPPGSEIDLTLLRYGAVSDPLLSHRHLRGPPIPSPISFL